MNARLLASGLLSCLSLLGCTPPGYIRTLDTTEIASRKNKSWLDFVHERTALSPSAGVPSPKVTHHHPHSNVMRVLYPARWGTQVSHETTRHYTEFKAFCESKGYKFIPIANRKPSSFDDPFPWPYRQWVDEDKAKYIQMMRKLGGLTFMEKTFGASIPRTSNTVDYLVSRGARELLPKLDNGGFIGDFDCARRNDKDPALDEVLGSVSIIPIDTCLTDAQHGLACIHIRFTAWQ
jgi:hypothetical protein